MMVADRRFGRIPATLPMRDASMVSEPLAAATSAHGDGLGADQFCSTRSALRSGQRSRWWSDQWNSSDSDDIGGESNPQSSADDDDGRDFFKKHQFYELGDRPSLLEGQCYSGNWRSDSRKEMKPWEAELRSGARHQVESMLRSVHLFRAARFCNSNGDLVQEVGVGPRSPADQRKDGTCVEDCHFQVTREKAIGILDEMHEMIKRWRHEDVAQRAAESAKMDQRPPATPHPTQSSFRGMKTDQNPASKFNSTTNWDAVDNDGEKNEEVWVSDDEDSEYKDGDISVEESDFEEREEDVSGDVGVDSVVEVIIEEGVRCKKEDKPKSVILAELCAALEDYNDNNEVEKDMVLIENDDEDETMENFFDKTKVATESLCKFREEGWDAEEIHAVAGTVVAAVASEEDMAVGDEFTVAANKQSDKVIQGRALCVWISVTLGKSTLAMKKCVVDTELIRNWKKMILALNALYPTLMIYTARAKSSQPADSSVVDKKVQVFDPGGGFIFFGVVFIITIRVTYEENFTFREANFDAVKSEAITEGEVKLTGC